MARKLKTDRRELTPVQKCRVWTLHEEGNNPSQIHIKTGYPRSTITGFLKRHTLAPTDDFKNQPGRGAMRKITPRGERHLVRTANLEPRMTLKALGSPSKSGKKLNHHIVAQVLKRNGKAKRRPRKKPFLTEEHKKRRVAHCKAEKAIKRDNRKVCWSDGSDI
jgi:hypothetical protein